jgi:ubiquitin-protein ligase
MARRRISNDLKRLAEQPLQGVSFEYSADNLFSLKATFVGPEGSDYEGGVFVVLITFPTGYPQASPARKFVTPIFHPNVAEDGALCKIEDWSPVNTISTVLQDMHAMFLAPDFHSPLNTKAGALWNENPEEYSRTVRQWTAQYATPA